MAGPSPVVERIPVYCYQCVAGPDLLKVVVRDGVAVGVEPNHDVADVHPACGKVCVRAYGLIQKLYNPARVTTPMRRTNPRKGRDEDPGWVPISWDDALGILAARLNGPSAVAGSSTRPAIRAWRPRSARAASPPPTSAPSPPSWRRGGRWTRASAAARASSATTRSTSTASSGTAPSPSRPTCPGADFVLSFGYNGDASGGVTGVFRHAEARARGLRWVQLEPHLSVTGAGADEWVPIRPKTDAAVLFALLHVILVEHDWRAVCDVPFLTAHDQLAVSGRPRAATTSAIPRRGKPLVWDLDRDRPVPFDDPACRQPAMDGELHRRRGRDRRRRRAPNRRGARAARLRPPRRPRAAVHAGVGRRDRRRAGRDDPPTGRGLPARTRGSGRRSSIDGVSYPHRPVAVRPRQDRDERLGRLRVLLGAHRAGGAGRRPRGAGRDRRHHRAAEPAGPEPPRLGPPRPRRIHGAAAEPDGQGHLGRRAPHPQRLPDARPPRRQLSVVAPRSVRRTCPGCSSTSRPSAGRRRRCPTCGSSTARTRPSPTGTPGASSASSSASPSSPPSPTRRTRRTGTRTCCCPRRRTSSRCSSTGSAAPSTSSSSGSTRAGRSASRCWRREAGPPTRATSRTSPPSWPRASVSSTSISRPSTGAPAPPCRCRGEGYDFAFPPGSRPSAAEIWDRVCRAATRVALRRRRGARPRLVQASTGPSSCRSRRAATTCTPRWPPRACATSCPTRSGSCGWARSSARGSTSAASRGGTPSSRSTSRCPAGRTFPRIWQATARARGRDPKEFPFWLLTSRSMQYSWGSNVSLPILADVARHVTGHFGVILNRGVGPAPRRRGRRPRRDRIADRPDTRARHPPRGRAPGRRRHPPAVRPLGHAVRAGPRDAQPEPGRDHGPGAHRRHRERGRPRPRGDPEGVTCAGAW